LTITVSQSDWDALWLEDWQKAEVAAYSDQFDITLQYPSQIGNGYKRWIQLRSGVSLVIHDYQLQDNVALEIEPFQSDLEFVFNLSGSLKLKDDCSVGRGQHYLLGTLGSGGLIEWQAGEQILEIDFHIEPYLLETLVDERQPLPSGLKQMIEGDEELSFLPPQKMTAGIQLALQQILHCPYQGLTKQLYLESKVLEVLALNLEQLPSSHESCQKSSSLCRDDMDRIYQAKDILIGSLQSPPSLLSLARQVGLNDCTLKRGFKQLFGTTAFGYLNNYRMEQARQLLADQTLTIEEIAHCVGYASRSSFVAAFRKKFGTCPSAYFLRRTLLSLNRE
jgi:AraC family transcriptional regulator, transcriptional activator of the genes for pyochelin and ferripyochelin receptors